MSRSYSTLSVGSTRSSVASDNPTLPPEVREGESVCGWVGGWVRGREREREERREEGREGGREGGREEESVCVCEWVSE